MVRRRLRRGSFLAGLTASLISSSSIALVLPEACQSGLLFQTVEQSVWAAWGPFVPDKDTYVRTPWNESGSLGGNPSGFCVGVPSSLGYVSIDADFGGQAMAGTTG